MQKEMSEDTESDAIDEELHDVLIAISVVAKQLARKIMTKGDKEECSRTMD